REGTAGGGVPELDVPAGYRPRRDHAPIGTVRQTGWRNLVGVADGVEFLSARHVPDPQSLVTVAACGGYLMTLGAELDLGAERGVRPQNLEFAAGRCVPDPGRPVLARGGEEPAVPAVADGPDPSLVPPERQELPAGDRVQHLDDGTVHALVPVGDRDPPAVGAEDDAHGDASVDGD